MDRTPQTDPCDFAELQLKRAISQGQPARRDTAIVGHVRRQLQNVPEGERARVPHGEVLP